MQTHTATGTTTPRVVSLNHSISTIHSGAPPIVFAAQPQAQTQPQLLPLQPVQAQPMLTRSLPIHYGQHYSPLQDHTYRPAGNPVLVPQPALFPSYAQQNSVWIETTRQSAPVIVVAANAPISHETYIIGNPVQQHWVEPCVMLPPNAIQHINTAPPQTNIYRSLSVTRGYHGSYTQPIMIMPPTAKITTSGESKPTQPEDRSKQNEAKIASTNMQTIATTSTSTSITANAATDFSQTASFMADTNNTNGLPPRGASRNFKLATLRVHDEPRDSTGDLEGKVNSPSQSTPTYGESDVAEGTKDESQDEVARKREAILQRTLRTKVDELAHSIETIESRLCELSQKKSEAEQTKDIPAINAQTSRQYYLDLSGEDSEEHLIKYGLHSSRQTKEQHEDHGRYSVPVTSRSKYEPSETSEVSRANSRASRIAPQPTQTRSSILRAKATAAKLSTESQSKSSTGFKVPSSVSPKSNQSGKSHTDTASQYSQHSRDRESLPSSRVARKGASGLDNATGKGDTPGYLKDTSSSVARRTPKA